MAAVRAASGRTKLFPLPEVTLFPGAGIPLHVFEPRYRSLVEDALAGDRVLGLARLVRGYTEKEYLGRPAVHSVLGVGVIAESEKLPEGRFNLIVRGVARARIIAEHEPLHSYREAQLEILDDVSQPVKDDEGESLSGYLVELSRRLDSEGARALGLISSLAEDPARMADQAAALLLPPDDCQTLLAELDPGRRVTRVREALAELLLSAPALKGARPS